MLKPFKWRQILYIDEVRMYFIKYGRNFYCQTFPSFISLYLSNGTCLLLLPRFCYAEILGLALFVLWLRWSLYQSVKVLIVTAVLPHAHTDLLIFFIRVQFDGLVSLFIRNVCTLSVAWFSHENQKKQEQITLFLCHSFLWLLALHQSPVLFFCLSACLSPSHAFNWNAITNTCPHIITLLSPSASCFQLSRLYTRHIG